MADISLTLPEVLDADGYGRLCYRCGKPVSKSKGQAGYRTDLDAQGRVVARLSWHLPMCPE